MSSRPELLFPLFADLSTLTGVGSKTAKSFSGLQVFRPRDLIFTLPQSLIDRSLVATVYGQPTGKIVTVSALVLAHRPGVRKSAPYRVDMEDSRGVFQLIFFHARADYLAKVLPVGSTRLISGKVESFDQLIQIAHPDYILEVEESASIPAIEPVYPLTAGITQKTVAKALGSALAKLPELEEWIDPVQKARSGWPSWRHAVQMAHQPRTIADLMAVAPARQRLAYDEFMAHQLTLGLARARLKKAAGRPSMGTGLLRRAVLASLPYQATVAQLRSIDEIAADMGAASRMNRLLQGDVGSGKTLVAFMALLIAVESKGQGVLMAPTEILARQHLEGLQPLAKAAGVSLTLLTGRDKGKDRVAKLQALQTGQTDILIGTHAVFQTDVAFGDLRLVVVDEQHRFGVRQRLELGRKGDRPDVLVMTATPIPRSLALAQYGDMDVSVLDEKPAGRQPITTAMVSTERIQEVLDHLRAAIKTGQQAYWVCPLVEESEVLDYKSASDRFASLRAALGEGLVELVHGQMPAPEKDAAMARFQSGDAKVLVATTVIEVGVNVPKASIMVIERAEAFGLAQLHQLRGRVGRGTQKSTCLLLYQAPLSGGGKKRLEILRQTDDGFLIAETDLQMRGAGDLIGTVQSGLPQFRIADLEAMTDLMHTAQSDARTLLSLDPKLTSKRGQAARGLLWLMEQDKAIHLLSVG
ncbi:ATP-dependent DNA helicase RecG [Rhodobacteraceae bacterium IMCC1335]